jgi:hypothetical protein
VHGVGSSLKGHRNEWIVFFDLFTLSFDDFLTRSALES